MPNCLDCQDLQDQDPYANCDKHGYDGNDYDEDYEENLA